MDTIRLNVLNKLHRQRNDAFNKKITLDIAIQREFMAIPEGGYSVSILNGIQINFHKVDNYWGSPKLDIHVFRETSEKKILTVEDMELILANKEEIWRKIEEKYVKPYIRD